MSTFGTDVADFVVATTDTETNEVLKTTTLYVNGHEALKWFLRHLAEFPAMDTRTELVALVRDELQRETGRQVMASRDQGIVMVGPDLSVEQSDA